MARGAILAVNDLNTRSALVLFVLAVGLGLAGCTKPSTARRSDAITYSQQGGPDLSGPRTPIAARTDAGAPYPSSDTPYEDAHGDAECTQDCSGHEAGYKWAEEHDVSDASECGGNSQSFMEGC